MTEPESGAVLERFALLADLEKKEAARYAPLCAEALSELVHRKKAGCGENADAPLVTAAATLAFYRKTLADDARGESSFSVGDVKVTRSGPSAPAAELLLRAALSAAAPYLEDPCFVFERIPE